MLTYMLIGFCISNGSAPCEHTLLGGAAGQTWEECQKGSREKMLSNPGMVFICATDAVSILAPFMPKMMCSDDNKIWWEARKDGMCYPVDKP